MDADQAAKSQSHHRVRGRDVHTRVRQSVRGSTAGSERTVGGLFSHAVLGEVHGSVAGNDLRAAEPAECAELCATLCATLRGRR